MNKSPNIYGEKYPVIWYQSEIDEALKKQLKKKKLVHFLSEYPKTVTFAKSLGISFLMMVPKDFDEVLFLKNLKKDIYQRRLADFEEEAILQEFPFEYDIAKSSNKFYLFYTREEFENELFVEKEIMKWDVKELAKGFREELLFWERKRRGLEKEDAIFERSDEPQGFDNFMDSMYCKNFCLENLKKLAKKRNQEKKKLVYFVNLGVSLYRWGEYQKSLESLMKACDVLEKIYGAEHPLTARIYRSLSMAYCKMGNYEKSIEFGLRAIEIRGSLGQEMHADDVNFFHGLANSFSEVKNHEKAIECYQKVLEIQKHIYGDNHLGMVIKKSIYGETHQNLASKYLQLAMNYSQSEQYEKAVEYYLKAAEIRKLDGSDPDGLYWSIVIAYGKMKDSPKTLEYHQKILDFIKSTYGEETHVKLASFYDYLGLVSSNCEQYQRALEFYLKALEMKKLLLGEEVQNKDLGDSYQNIGATYKELKQHEKAVENYLKAIEIQESLPEKSDKTLASLYFDIGVSYTKLREYPKALEYHQKSLDIKKSIYGEVDLQTANSYNRLGLVSSNLRDFQKALEFHTKALNLYISIHGELHSSVAIGYDNLAETHSYMAEYENALEFSLKSLHINTTLHGEIHQKTRDSHRRVAGFCILIPGQYENGIEHEMKALEIAKSIHGENHEDVRKSHVQLKYFYERLQQDEKGIGHLTKALEIAKAIYGELHEEVVKAHHLIYLACLRPQDYKKGLEHELKILEITKGLYGEISLETASAYDKMAHALAFSFRDRAQSKKYLSKALAIYKLLLKKDPSDTDLPDEIEDINDQLSYHQRVFEAQREIYDTNVIK